MKRSKLMSLLEELGLSSGGLFWDSDLPAGVNFFPVAVSGTESVCYENILDIKNKKLLLHKNVWHCFFGGKNDSLIYVLNISKENYTKIIYVTIRSSINGNILLENFT